MEEELSEWENSFVDSAALFSTSSVASGSAVKASSAPSHRVILHFDLDCFYAQVEMIRNPALRCVPLGVQQKYIIVTSNYVARGRGVTKLMSVSDAKEKCPELVLVNGEDLTHYREMSYKVTELLMSYCPLVERLGFDENFMDVTEMVEQKLKQIAEPGCFSFKGHVYNHSSDDANASDHPRLALGSHIAAELREAVRCKLGLTGCAGIATNKLLAKLVSGTFKPNQQTVLLQENVGDIMGCLSGLRKVPGVGHQTAKKLQSLGLVSVKDLQVYPLNDLAKQFGGPTAQRLKNLVLGVDDSPVTSSGAPQSLSDEDSFKKMSSTKEVVEKIQQLLSSLIERMQKDGRQPQTFRLTIRRFTTTNKWFSRESRQCPIPNSIGQKISSENREEAVVPLVSMAMKLFQKMVDSSADFHLTLINVCFSNLQMRGAAVSGRGAITSFFTQNASPRKPQLLPSQNQDDSPRNAGGRLDTQIRISPQKKHVTPKSSTSSDGASHGFKWKQDSVVEENQTTACCSEVFCPDATADTAADQLPPDVDPEVFKLLPEEIQKELLSPLFLNSLSSYHLVSGVTHKPTNKSSDSERIGDPANTLDTSNRATAMSQPAGTSGSHGENVMEGDELPFPQPSDCKFPGNVDPEVFSELPPDVQQELMSEWKQQKLILKTPSSRKPGRGSVSKDRKSAGKSSQANNLFKYFKPS
uniref:Polymerase (DNA directed) iota n=1 Tax=Nothobranchius pienaari TaxID=704102 RepID=A0A1A8P6G1_9TELE